jgi:hypothetical protein
MELDSEMDLLAEPRLGPDSETINKESTKLKGIGMLPRKNSRKYQWWCHFHPAKLEP